MRPEMSQMSQPHLQESAPRGGARSGRTMRHKRHRPPEKLTKPSPGLLRAQRCRKCRYACEDSYFISSSLSKRAHAHAYTRAPSFSGHLRQMPPGARCRAEAPRNLHDAAPGSIRKRVRKCTSRRPASLAGLAKQRGARIRSHHWTVPQRLDGGREPGRSGPVSLRPDPSAAEGGEAR